MAYDQNSLPNDLRPLNIGRTVPEDPRISPATSSGRPIEGFFAAQPRDGSPGTIPVVYYPASGTDAGFVGLGYSNCPPAVARWVQQVVPPAPPGVVASTLGFNQNSLNFGAQSLSSASDQASDEGGDDSAPGRKLKFLCSFGGKILPRPSDGALRYVGGQTRIVSLRKDVNFPELSKKLTDTCGQDVIIKYQLPDEDLDALVSISCPDDLENMMDEYQKLVERSSDGSAKLRVFLFPASDVNSPSAIQFTDLHDSGQRYVDAVNGISDGGITRLSSVSTQNSDVSSVEVVDGSCHSHPEITRSPSSDAVSQDTSSATVYVNTSSAPFGIPMVMSGPPPVFAASENLSNKPVPGVTFPVPSYADHHREALNRADYVPFASQMGYSTHFMGTVGPVYTQQQFVPPHVSMSPKVVPMYQPQQTRPEQHPSESMVAKQFAQLSRDQPQLPATVLSGQVALAQPTTTTLVTIPRYDDCHMCQKSLPHAHSDTAAQDKQGSPVNSISDSNSAHSIRLPRAVTSGALLECTGEKSGASVEQRFVGLLDKGAGVSESVENLEHPKVSAPLGVMGLTSGVQTLCGACMGTVPQSSQANAPEQPFVPMQFQVKQESVLNNAVPEDLLTAGYTQHFPVMLPKEDNIESSNAYGHLKQIEDRMENLRVQRAEILANSDKSPVDNFRKNEFLESRSPQVGFSKNPVVDATNLKPYEISPTSPNEAVCFQTIWAQERPSLLGDSNVFVHSKQGVNCLVPDEISLGNCPFSGVIPNSTDFISSDINTSSPSVSYELGGDAQESTNSLFSNQDPWSMHHDTRFPPQPNKLQVRKEPVDAKALKDNTGVTHGGLGTDMGWNEGVSQPSGYFDMDFGSKHIQSNKGSAEEVIKKELQAVAEGVAASVLPSSVPSNPNGKGSPSTSEWNGEVQIAQGERKTKYPMRENLGFPVSGDIGRLQIIKNSDLEEIRELGSGTFGTVYHGKWRGTDVAIKRINDRCFAGKPSEQERMRDDFWNEAIKLADLHHPNVVAFYGVVLDGPGGSVATVTEYMVNGSLRTALQKSERNLDKRKRLLISMDVAFGMEYLHGKNIVHFDLKSDNLLVNLRDPHRPICKVGDLGLSKVKCQTLISGGVRGTLPWMAPELLNGSSSLVSEKVDVFSFGIVMWELLTGEEPYADLHYGAIIGGIVNNTLRPSVPESCDADWKSLMERCWSAEPSERPTFTEIANELRAIAAMFPAKGQQPVLSTQTQPRS